jgi:hypothetical protein
LATCQEAEGKKKDSLWLIHEMLERNDTFFRDMPIDEAHMATLHFGSKKNSEYEGSTYDAPTKSPTEMQKANDDRKWKIIQKHIMSCDEENQTRLFIKNGLKKDGLELARTSTCAMYKTNKPKWVRDPNSNRTPDQFSWNDAFYSKTKSLVIAWDTEATTDGEEIHERYMSNFYCKKYGSKSFETEKQMLNFLHNKGEKDSCIYAHNAKYDISSSSKGILSNLRKQDRCELDGNMIYIKGEFFGMNVRIVDSYKFISTKLDAVSEMFGFENLEKEIMPYYLFLVCI